MGTKVTKVEYVVGRDLDGDIVEAHYLEEDRTRKEQR